MIRMATTNPKTVKWVLESYGRWPEEIVDAGIPRSIMEKMLSETASIDDADLRRMADAICCPLNMLCLPEPPTETPLCDFGKPRGANAVLSRATLQAVRRARYMQFVGGKLLSERGLRLEPDIPHCMLNDDPEDAAEAQRSILCLDMAGYYPKEMTDREFYEGLRDRIESLNIFTCKSGLDWDQTCGFVISGEHPCVLVVAAMGEVSEAHTLLHLYGHALLRETGACPAFHGLDTSWKCNLGDKHTRIMESESWCNRFAAHLLMPRSEFMKHRAAFDDMDGADLHRLCRTFRTTSPVLEAHAVRLGLMPLPRVIGDAPFVTLNGKKFTKLVLNAYGEGRITRFDAVEYLEYEP